jgi:hypothetical protein
MSTLPLALHALGRSKESDAALQAFIDKYGEVASLVGIAYGYIGNADKAFEWLEKGAELHDPAVSQVMMDPLLDGLHDDPRWLPYLRSTGYAPEQLAKIEFHVTLPQQAAAQ